MIYVIKVEYKDIDLLKIGYTKDENKDTRYSQYKMHNPLYRVIYEIPGGTEEQEKILHQKFSEYLYTGREWFRCNEDIIKFFDRIKTLEELESEISDFISELKPISKKIYCQIIDKCLNIKLGSTLFQTLLMIEKV